MSKIETFAIEFPDYIHFPREFTRFISYDSPAERQMQSDVDYCFNDNEHVIYIESKTMGCLPQPQQKRNLSTRCKLDCYCAVIAYHERPSDKNYVEMVDGFNQVVGEYFWKGEWHNDKSGMNLKDFINWFFRTNWGHSSDFIT